MYDFTSISAIIAAIVRTVQTDCPGITVKSDFPSEKADFPLKSPHVIIGIKHLSLPFNDGTFSGSDSSGTKYYSTVCQIDCFIKVYVPKTMKGTNCYNTFDSVVNSLVNLTEIGIEKVYCDGIKYNRLLGAVEMTAGADITAKIV